MADNLTEASLSPAATNRIDRLVRRYAILAGLTLLALNISAGAATIWAFWSSAYTTAKQEYRDSLAVLEKQWEAEKTLREAEKTLLAAKMTSELDQSVNAKFNNQDVRRRLDQITMDAGRLEAESKAAADKAKSAAKGAEVTSENASTSAREAIEKATASMKICSEAQMRADEALKTAEETSKELKERLKTIQTSDVELAKSISLMIELLKDEKNQPLSKLDTRITGVDTRISGVDAKINSLTVRLGTPINWKLGADASHTELHKALSSGFIVLTSGGDGVEKAEGGVRGQNGRAFYELDPSRTHVLGTAGVSYVLPANAGDEFQTWGNPKNVHVFFFPLEIDWIGRAAGPR